MPRQHDARTDWISRLHCECVLGVVSHVVRVFHGASSLLPAAVDSRGKREILSVPRQVCNVEKLGEAFIVNPEFAVVVLSEVSAVCMATNKHHTACS